MQFAAAQQAAFGAELLDHIGIDLFYQLK